MAMGPIFMASLLKMPIVPVGFGYQNPWRAKTWDRFAIPKPFSRARAIMGPKIYIPPRLDRDKMEQYRLQIETLTTNLTTVAENWARDGGYSEASVAAKIDRKLSAIEFKNNRRRRPAKEGLLGTIFRTAVRIFTPTDYIYELRSGDAGT